MNPNAYPGHGDLGPFPEDDDPPCAKGMDCDCELCTCQDCGAKLIWTTKAGALVGTCPDCQDD